MTETNKGDKYYYSKGGQQFGPYSLNELLPLIDHNTMVWKKGIEWTNAKNMPEIQPLLGTKKKSSISLKQILIVLLFLGIAGGGYYFLSDKGGEKQNKDETGETSYMGDLKENILSSKKIRVGFEPDAPPAYFKGDDDKPTGFDYELIKFISEEVFGGAEIEPVEAGYDELPKLLKEGKIDVIAGGYTPDNIAGVDFTQQYLQFGLALITTKGKMRVYKTKADISNDRIGLYDESAEDWAKKEFPNAKIQIIGDKENEDTPESDWMADLVNGNVDLVIYDYPFAANEIADYEGIGITAKNLNGEDLREYSLGIPAGNLKTLEEINQAIEEYKSSARYARNIAKFIPNPGEDENANISKDNFYVVKDGETLSLIAAQHLGDKSKWSTIYKANPHIASPNIIYVGQGLNKTPGWID